MVSRAGIESEGWAERDDGKILKERRSPRGRGRMGTSPRARFGVCFDCANGDGCVARLLARGSRGGGAAQNPRRRRAGLFIAAESRGDAVRVRESGPRADVVASGHRRDRALVVRPVVRDARHDRGDVRHRQRLGRGEVQRRRAES
eukprot:31227-Pelagococcus_subviridis.AAC.3